MKAYLKETAGLLTVIAFMWFWFAVMALIVEGMA